MIAWCSGTVVRPGGGTLPLSAAVRPLRRRDTVDSESLAADACVRILVMGLTSRGPASTVGA